MVVKLSRNFKSADIDVKCYHMILTVVNPLFCANMVCMSDSALVLILDYHWISHQCYCLFISMPQEHFIHFIKVVFFIQNIVTVWNVWYRYVVYFKQQQFQVLSILDYCKQKPQPKPVSSTCWKNLAAKLSAPGYNEPSKITMYLQHLWVWYHPHLEWSAHIRFSLLQEGSPLQKS